MATFTEAVNVVSADDRGMSDRVLSTNSLLGLIGLEGEDSEDVSTAASNNITNSNYASPVMEENQQGGGEEEGGGEEDINVELSPSTRNSQQDIDDITIMTTPPGSIQGPGILSLSPPLLTTYSSSTNGPENYISLQPHQQSRQSMYQHHSSQEESPQLSLPTTTSAQAQQQHQPRSRPPRAPQFPSSEVGGNNNGHIIFPRPTTSIGPESGASSGPGGGHTRTPTDATNYSFLSCLTDMDVSNGGGGGPDFTLSRRRTLSWDNNVNVGAGAAALAPAAPVGSNSLGGSSLPGSILQPILRKEEETESVARPPMSIWASNLRKVSPPPAKTSPRRALIPPSVLSSRENLHPFLAKLQQNSSSPPNLTLACSSSTHTATTTATRSPFAYAQDEKKDDDPFRSPMQPLFERDASNATHLSPSDFTSYSPSPSTTIRLRKRNTANFRSSPNIVTQRNDTQRSNNIHINNHNNIGYTKTERLGLKDTLMSNKESVEESEIVEGVERDIFSDSNGVISDDVQVYYISEVWPYLILVWGIFNLDHQRGSYLEWFVEVISPLFCKKFSYFCLGLGAITIIKRVLFKQLLKERIAGK
jgi:hypothetical protein